MSDKILLALFVFTLVGSVSLPFMKTPYALGCAFMLTLISVTIYLIATGPTWYPVVFLIVHAGGVMVLFLYMACLSPNQRIEGPKQAMRWGFSLFLVLMVYFTVYGWPTFSVGPYTDVDEEAIDEIESMITAPSDLMTADSGDILIFCGVFMFISMLVVVKLCKYQRGPLRPFMRTKKKKEEKL